MKYKSFLTVKTIFLLSLILYFSTITALAQNGVLRIGLNSDPETICSVEFKSQSELPIVNTISPGLMSSGNPRTQKRRLNLAESAEMMENKKDILVKIKKGYAFHTGDPLTSEDIKFTVQQAQLPESANVIQNMFDEVKNIEIVDEHTVIYQFYEPFAPWQEVMWVGVCSKNYYEKVGRAKFRSHPVGCGPMKFKERKLGEYILVERVKNYPDDKPDFKQIKYYIVSDPITRLTMLIAKELDLIFDVLPHQIPELKQHPQIKIKIAKPPSFYYLSIKPTLFPELKDVKVRMAINHAINRQEIIDKVFFREGYPLYTYANKGEKGYDPSYTVEYNVEKARKLLKESNYKPQTPIIITYTSMMPNAPIVATIVQKYLKNIGINAMITQLEYGTYLTYARNRDRRAGHMCLSHFSVDNDPNMHLALGMGSNSTYSYYTDRPNQKEMDNLILTQSRETNLEKRLEILKKIHEINNADPGLIPLFGLHAIYAMDRKVDYTWIPGAIYPAENYTTKLVKK